jgi:hypothetical protein
MVREPDATLQPQPQHHQLMSKRRVLGFKPQRRLERRGQDGQHETEQPDHPASLGDSNTSPTRTRFSVHTTRRSSRARSARDWKRAQALMASHIRGCVEHALKEDNAGVFNTSAKSRVAQTIRSEAPAGTKPAVGASKGTLCRRAQGKALRPPQMATDRGPPLRVNGNHRNRYRSASTRTLNAGVACRRLG